MMPPPETFNRWLYEQLSQPSSHVTTNDPILRWPQSAVETSVIKREIEAVMPCRMRPLTSANLKSFYQCAFLSSLITFLHMIFTVVTNLQNIPMFGRISQRTYFIELLLHPLILQRKKLFFLSQCFFLHFYLVCGSQTGDGSNFFLETSNRFTFARR